MATLLETLEKHAGQSALQKKQFPLDWEELFVKIGTEKDQAKIRQKTGNKLPLHFCAELNAPLKVIRALLDAYPEAREVKDGLGWLPIKHAIDAGCAQEVLDSLTTPEIKETQQKLWKACRESDFSLAKSLLGTERNEIVLQVIDSVDPASKLRETALLACCRRGSHQIMRLVMRYLPNLRKADANGASPLLIALQGRHVECIDMLQSRSQMEKRYWSDNVRFIYTTSMTVELRGPIMDFDFDRRPCKMCMDISGSLAKFFFEDYESFCSICLGIAPETMWCDFGQVDAAGRSPIDEIATTSDDDVLSCFDQKSRENPILLAVGLSLASDALQRLLAKYHEKVLEKDANSFSVLHLALELGASADIIKALLDAAPSLVDLADGEGNLPLHCAAHFSSLDIFQLVLGKSEDASKQPNNKGELPLHVAAQYSGDVALVNVLLAAFPVAISAKDNDGNMPLHSAARGSSYEVIEAIFKAWREAALVPNNGKNLPLHLLALGNGDLTSMQLLLDANPETIKAKDVKGSSILFLSAGNKRVGPESITYLRDLNLDALCEANNQLFTPFSAACERTDSQDLLAVLKLLEYEGCASTVSDLNWTCLHSAAVASHWADVEAISYLLGLHPEGTKALDSGKRSPLYFALVCGSAEAVELLYKADPDASITPSDECLRRVPAQLPLSLFSKLMTVEICQRKQFWHGRLPLHNFADKIDCPTEQIVHLLQTFPEAAKATDRDGNLPLHLACSKCRHLSTISVILKANVDGARRKNSEGKLPMHCLLSNENVTCEAYSLLLDAWPAAVSEKTPDGFALHYALQTAGKRNSNYPFQIIEQLLAAHPAAARERDKYGRIPLVLGVSCLMRMPALFDAILSAYPAVARQMDNEKQLPIEAYVQKATNFDHAIITKLLLLDLPIDLNTGAPAASYGGSWAAFIEAANSKVSLARRVVQSVLERLPQSHCYALAHAKDKKGREVISIAHQEIQELMYAFIFFCGRYDLQEGPPVHRSATAVVVYARDYGVHLDYKHAFAFALSSKECHRAAPAAGAAAVPGDATLSLAGFEAALSLLDLHSASLDGGLDETFRSWDKDSSGGLSASEFVDNCLKTYGRDRKVVIKFMRNEDQYVQELEVRTNGNLDPKYVVSVLPGPREDVFREQVQGITLYDGRTLSDYPYGIVMPAADRSFDAIFRSERPDLTHIGIMMKEVAEALQHCHKNRVVHGDLKMLNALRVQNRIRLIDMDASAIISKDFLGAKFSSATLPPELFYKFKGQEERQYDVYWKEYKSAQGNSKNEAEKARAELWQKIRPRGYNGSSYVVRTFLTNTKVDEKGLRFHEPISAGLPYDLVPASETADVWAFGVMLFFICSGEPILPVNRDDDLVDAMAFSRAAEWEDKDIRKRINDIKIEGENANAVKDLLRKVLKPKPEERLSLQGVIEHAFFVGRRVVGRVPDDELIDVFISYRQDSDAEMAKLLYSTLSELGLKVWRDQECLPRGKPWEEGFCEGLVKSRCFVPILSRSALKARLEQLHEQSPCDNVLLEYRLAGELQARGHIECIFPLFVGEMSFEMGKDFVPKATFANYFKSELSAPSPPSSAVVASVEAKLRSHLERLDLGAPLQQQQTVCEVFKTIISTQGGFVEGTDMLPSIIKRLAQEIVGMVDAIKCPNGGGDAVVTQASTPRERLLEEQVRELQERLERSLLAKQRQTEGSDASVASGGGRRDEQEGREEEASEVCDEPSAMTMKPRPPAERDPRSSPRFVRGGAEVGEGTP